MRRVEFCAQKLVIMIVRMMKYVICIMKEESVFQDDDVSSRPNAKIAGMFAVIHFIAA